MEICYEVKRMNCQAKVFVFILFILLSYVIKMIAIGLKKSGTVVADKYWANDKDSVIYNLLIKLYINYIYLISKTPFKI